MFELCDDRPIAAVRADYLATFVGDSGRRRGVIEFEEALAQLRRLGLVTFRDDRDESALAPAQGDRP